MNYKVFSICILTVFLLSGCSSSKVNKIKLPDKVKSQDVRETATYEATPEVNKYGRQPYYFIIKNTQQYKGAVHNDQLFIASFFFKMAFAYDMAEVSFEVSFDGDAKQLM